MCPDLNFNYFNRAVQNTGNLHKAWHLILAKEFGKKIKLKRSFEMLGSNSYYSSIWFLLFTVFLLELDDANFISVN